MNEMSDLKEEFIQEAGDHLANVEDDVLEIEKDGANFSPDTINHLFRAIHSVKGGSGFLEFTNITELSHALENVVGKIRDGNLIPNENITESLLNGIDKLKLLLNNIDKENEIDITDELDAIKQLMASPIVAEHKSVPGPGDAEIRSGEINTDGAGKVSSITISESSSVTKKEENYVYNCTIDLISECDLKNRLPADLFHNFNILGKVTNASFNPISTESLINNPDDKLIYNFDFSTVIEDKDMLMAGLDISPISIRQISPRPAVEAAPPEPEHKSEDLLSSEESKEISLSRVTTEKIKKEVITTKEVIKKTLSGKQLKTKPDLKARPAPDPRAPQQSAGSTIRISLSLLDKLMNLAGELVLVRNQNAQAVEAGNLEQLRVISKKLNVVTSGLQAGVMQTRMQPLDTVFSKFTRLVRDLSKKLNKDINFKIKGKDVELDKNIIETIGDPLTHLVRNAVDHGIELPGEREEQNKSKTGTVVLSAYHQAGYVNISVRDDGKGMDPQKLKAAAVQKGILEQNLADSMSDEEAFNLIFEPGFSTASSVTDVSGRGVGMDVVRTNFKKLGGVIDVSSAVGKGTSIEIRLPLTLAIIPALIVSVERLCYAVPQFNIAEVVSLFGEEVYQKVKKINEQEVFTLREKLVPIIRLSMIMGLNKTYFDPKTNQYEPDRRRNELDRRESRGDVDYMSNLRKQNEKFGRRVSPANMLYILILHLGNTQYGLVVDTIIDAEEIVVKPLHEQLKKCRIYSGTTVLGDGRIAMILDIGNLAELGKFKMTQIEERKTIKRTEFEDQQSVISFNIGSKEVFAIPLFLIAHIEQIKPGDIMIAKEREYLHLKGDIAPLVRLENCIESIRGNYDEDLYVIIIKANKPIGILVSQIVDTTMIKSKIDTTTVSKPGIIGVEVINGKLTLILDVFRLVEIIEPGWFLSDKDSIGTIKKVLLLEDTQFYSSLIKSFLTGTGIEVVAVSNGREGIKALERDDFDFIMSDIEMPVMNGFEFAKYVRSIEKYRTIPMIALSAVYDEEEGIRVAKEAGFDNLISKHNKEGMMDSLKQISYINKKDSKPE